MPESATNPVVEVYQFHVLLLQISPAIWRRVLVRSDSSLADLHYTLQILMGWSDVHLHRFLRHAKEYGTNKPGFCFDHNPARVRLAALKLRRNERFIYEYDLRDNCVHQLRLEQVLPLDPAKSYPICLAGGRQAPPEDCGGPWQFMERRQHDPWRLTQRLTEVLEDPEDDIYEHRAELRELMYWLHADKLNRRAINQQLRQYATDPQQWLRSHQEVHILI